MTVPGLPRLDELLANAWPAAVTEEIGGWRLRWTHGVTRRANSALAVGTSTDLDVMIDATEAFYDAHHAPTLIQVSTASSPPDLWMRLKRRGYRPQARTLVQQAPCSDVLRRAVPGDHAVEVSDSLNDDWLDGYWSVEAGSGRADADREVARRVLLAPERPTVFVAVRVRSEVVGVGQAVVDGSWAGIQCMATVPSHRGQGVAGSVLHALARASQARDAANLYLAVMADNPAAGRLYVLVGFSDVHEYEYASR